MASIDCANLVAFLQNLQLPPLTQEEENQLTEDKRAERERLATHIRQLHNIGLRIDHCAMVCVDSLSCGCMLKSKFGNYL